MKPYIYRFLLFCQTFQNKMYFLLISPCSKSTLWVKGPYHPFNMSEPNIFSFHTCYITNNHFPKHKTDFTSCYFATSTNLSN
ncbi:hypothetical protein LDENG_00150000 [Lucifuga dentata]|nr:hypothetical protein LDENG_00150000 [Lucifuga dentata]